MPSKGHNVRRVFISSTVYDLKNERLLVRRILEQYRGTSGVKFEIIASDHPDFPISPADRAKKHSFDLCIENIAKADYFVLLLKKRYGTPIISHNGLPISITHREFREAHRLKIPRFVLIDKRTWDAKHAHDRGVPQKFVLPAHTQIFDFIDEIRTRTKGNWIDIIKGTEGISTLITSFLDGYDDSVFIGDVTVPHGAIVGTSEKLVKTWEIENRGLTVWKNRFLREDNPSPWGVIPEQSLIPIPLTRPGMRIKISVKLNTPQHPGTYESWWKIVDQHGNYCFPHKIGLLCCLKVV